jgi:hypothetical protein
MATKSILKTIQIKDPRAAKRLALALDHAQKKSAKHVTISKSYSDVRADELRSMFGSDNDRI